MDNLLGITVETDDACVPPRAGDGHAPEDAAFAQLLRDTTSVAVVGVSPTPGRTSNGVARWMVENTHFDVYFVNPVAAGQEIFGKPVYASLADLPVVPDLVDVFRRSEVVPPVVDDAIAVGSKIVFMQLGIINENAAATARAAGLEVIQNRCMWIEYDRLITKPDAAR